MFLTHGPCTLGISPEFLPGECHGQRTMEGYSSWGRQESDITFFHSLSRFMDTSMPRMVHPHLWVQRGPWGWQALECVSLSHHKGPFCGSFLTLAVVVSPRVWLFAAAAHGSGGDRCVLQFRVISVGFREALALWGDLCVCSTKWTNSSYDHITHPSKYSAQEERGDGP